MEFRIWTMLIEQSRGALHVFLPLLDRGLDGVIHRLTDGEYIPVQVKSRGSAVEGMVEIGLLKNDHQEIAERPREVRERLRRGLVLGDFGQDLEHDVVEGARVLAPNLVRRENAFLNEKRLDGRDALLEIRPFAVVLERRVRPLVLLLLLLLVLLLLLLLLLVIVIVIGSGERALRGSR